MLHALLVFTTKFNTFGSDFLPRRGRAFGVFAVFFLMIKVAGESAWPVVAAAPSMALFLAGVLGIFLVAGLNDTFCKTYCRLYRYCLYRRNVQNLWTITSTKNRQPTPRLVD